MKSDYVAGLIIAAGFSGRMDSFKPLLEINGKSFLQIIVEKVLTVCDEVIVVSGFNSDKISSELKRNNLIDRCKVVYNETYSEGMFSSLKSGLNCIQSKWVLYHFIDQPTLPQKFYNHFASQISNEYDWIQPVNKGRNGHPVLFNNIVSDLIISSDNSASLREISQKSEIKKLYWNCDYNEILEDIDRPKDFQRIINRNNYQGEA